MRSWKQATPTSTISLMTPYLILDGAVVDAHTQVRSAAQRLRNTLRLNAATSLLGGVAAATVGGPVNTLLGASSTNWVRVVGFGLVLFAIDVAIVAGSNIQKLQTYTPSISAADAVWVGASVTTIALGWFSTRGGVVVGVVAAMVAAFGARQFVLARRLALAAHGIDQTILTESPPSEIFHCEVPIAEDAASAWSIVTDHALYGRLAPNLGSVVATTPNGPDLARTCSNRSGEQWLESCTLWHDGKQYDIEVDTTNYPYPLAEMRGSWWVRETNPTTVGMDFRYRPNASIGGRLFAIAMQVGFPLVLRRIMRGWQAAARAAN